MPDRRITHFVIVALAAVLAACASQVPPRPAGEHTAPAEFPSGHYQRLHAQGKRIFQVEPARSVVAIEVRRGGSLAHFGHDHVIASHDVAGYVAPDEGRADLVVPLATLAVDEPALRTEAGLDTQPSATDVEATRRNMLDKVLEAERYPYALIAVSALAAGGSARPLRANVTLHGTTRPVDVAAQVDEITGFMIITGTLALDQSEFDITPFSILGGAIAVQDRVKITFRIYARRME